MATTTGVNLTFSNGTDVNVTTPQSVDDGRSPSLYYKQQADNMWTYIPPIIIAVGTVGNVLTIIILLRQIRRLSSTAMYLLTLALSDLMILWLGPLRQWILTIWEEDIRKRTEAGCKVQIMLTYATVQISSWILAAVTIERLLSVVAPHRVRLICTPTRAGIVISLILASIIGLNAHYLWGMEFNVYIEEAGRYFDCLGKTMDYLEFLMDVWPWIDFVVAFLLPFTVILVGNITIIVKLGARQHHRRKMSSSSQLSSAERENRTITFMLITLSVVFCLCMTPVSVYYIYLPQLVKKVLAITDPVEFAEAELFYFHYLSAVVNMIGYINASANFILYVISGSKFRGELKALFTCKKLKPSGVFGSASGSKSRDTRSSYLTSSHGAKSTELNNGGHNVSLKDKSDTNSNGSGNDVDSDKSEGT